MPVQQPFRKHPMRNITMPKQAASATASARARRWNPVQRGRHKARAPARPIHAPGCRYPSSSSAPSGNASAPRSSTDQSFAPPIPPTASQAMSASIRRAGIPVVLRTIVTTKPAVSGARPRKTGYARIVDVSSGCTLLRDARARARDVLAERGATVDALLAVTTAVRATARRVARIVRAHVPVVAGRAGRAPAAEDDDLGELQRLTRGRELHANVAPGPVHRRREPPADRSRLLDRLHVLLARGHRGVVRRERNIRDEDIEVLQTIAAAVRPVPELDLLEEIRVSEVDLPPVLVADEGV